MPALTLFVELVGTIIVVAFVPWLLWRMLRRQLPSC